MHQHMHLLDILRELLQTIIHVIIVCDFTLL